MASTARNFFLRFGFFFSSLPQKKGNRFLFFFDGPPKVSLLPFPLPPRRPSLAITPSRTFKSHKEKKVGKWAKCAGWSVGGRLLLLAWCVRRGKEKYYMLAARSPTPSMSDHSPGLEKQTSSWFGA